MTEIVADMGSLEKTIKKTASPEEAERAAIRELVVAARARGEDLTGPDGLLKTLTKTVLETALEEELSEHLVDELATTVSGRGPQRRQLPQREAGQDGGERRCRAGADRGAAGPGRHLRPGHCPQATATADGRGHGGAVAVCEGSDHLGDQRALRRG